MIATPDDVRRRQERREMVEIQLRRRRISNRRVLAAMTSVPRHCFVPKDLQDFAYEDAPLTIGYGQTISQPYIVALMTELAALNRHSRVLEIGTGSGYHTAVLAKIAHHVWSIERIPELAIGATRRLRKLGIRNVDVQCGDGSLGVPGEAPFDAIVIAAAAPSIPQTLLDQLVVGGRMVIPIGGSRSQELTLIIRTAHGYGQHPAGACRFVPFVSDHA